MRAPAIVERGESRASPSDLLAGTARTASWLNGAPGGRVSRADDRLLVQPQAQAEQVAERPQDDVGARAGGAPGRAWQVGDAPLAEAEAGAARLDQELGTEGGAARLHVDRLPHLALE